MAKGLCIGYSVTELRGFVEEVNRLAREEGALLSLHRSGWGGHSIETIAYLVDQIIAAGFYDFVILEIATAGWHLPVSEFTFYTEQTLAILARAQLPIMLLSLYVDDPDPRRPAMVNYIRELSERANIPHLDIEPIMAQMLPDLRASMFGDKVHTTPAGSAFYGEVLYGFLKNANLPTAYIDQFAAIERVLSTLKVVDLVDESSVIKLHRNGTLLDFVEIKETKHLTIKIPHPLRLQAVMMIFGPRSGKVRLRSAHNFQFVDALPYDDFCYYERSCLISVELDVEGALHVFQLSELPSIVLRKGEANLEPRLGRISHLMYMRQ